MGKRKHGRQRLDHERRLAKTEATMDAVSLDLREIKADVKSLVRGTP